MRARDQIGSAASAAKTSFTSAKLAWADWLSGRLSFPSREKQCNPLGGFVLLADRQNGDRDRQADKSAGDPPEKAPEKYREQDNEWRHGQSGAGNSRLEIAAYDELNDVETYKHSKADLPGSSLNKNKERGKNGRNQRAEKRYVVQNKGDHAPRCRELNASNQGEAPHHDAGQDAHGGPHHHIFLKFLSDLLGAQQKRLPQQRAVQVLDIFPCNIDFK